MKILKANFLKEIKSIINESRDTAIRSVDTVRVLMYWKIGKKIFEEEQLGKHRADYGTHLIQSLAVKLETEYGSGFSVRQLELFRQFYRTFTNTNALRSQFSWTHYKLLIRIESKDKRNFYIAESTNNHWAARQLERQINTSLYERLLASSNKKKVLAIAHKKEVPTSVNDIVKDPTYLEFMGLKKDVSYYEEDIETAIITHLQDFILELGNGFSFVARQKRLHLNGDDYYADLVFYNRLLQCFVVVEIKTHKITHEDVGQLQMYVNYFDRFEKTERENPTIGILLCADKNDAMVKITLPKDNKTIVATRYEMYLPKEKALLTEMKKQIKQLDVPKKVASKNVTKKKAVKKKIEKK